jgi:hypothetical protein
MRTSGNADSVNKKKNDVPCNLLNHTTPSDLVVLFDGSPRHRRRLNVS